MEAELQDEEGDIQTIWLNIKEKAAPVLWKLGTHIPHITLLTASSELGKQEPLVSLGTRHFQKMHPLEVGTILVACDFPFTLAGMQEHHTEADVGLFCHA